ncbi:hypothetical protein GCM10023340_38690 [Nocardioides marinquilinus]|uniref:Uncharacterized protein n=1 Tax=Nocardioides marinquilinus TaxID=1210400 RepID=A0ABP9PZN5_9ACTN
MSTTNGDEAVVITDVTDLGSLPINSVLVDRIGVAWQVVELGADWSYAKGQRDTRRPGFVQAGNHVRFEAAALVSVLPMRVVDDGRAVQS